ncbi:MAG: C40 family peptidase [Brachymonas sp.]|nr:C40 family peptidase [Brachymonas sp.]
MIRPALLAWGVSAALCCASTGFAQSQSNAPTLQKQDDLAAFLGEKGLIDKIGDQMNTAGRAVSEKASELVVAAMGFLGVPYKRGGNSFEQGLDCSGFVRLIYEQTAGMILPRRSAEQAAATQPIDKSELQPGDLVFFNTLKSAFSHVGIYVGDHKFIHAPRTGAVVRVEDMRVGYWQQRFNGARRVPMGAAVSKPHSSAQDAASASPSP